MKTEIFRGTASALVTPFTNTGIDYDALERLIDEQIDSGINALVIAGTTGEASTMPDEEHIELIRQAKHFINGRVPLIAGTGSNDTQHGIELSKAAVKVGADALLLVTPYYNKSNQEGLVQHFTATANAVDVPLILYNVPSRTAMNIEPETYYTLASNEQFVGIKECNLNQVAETRRLCGDAYAHYSGEDGLVIPMMSLGGLGVISVTSNIAPKQMVAMTKAWLDGDIRLAAKIQIELMDIINACFTDVNPIPVKAALNLIGKAVGEPRLPLVSLDKKKTEALRDVLIQNGFIN